MLLQQMMQRYDYDARVYLYTKPLDQMPTINSDVIPTDLMVHF